MSMLVPWLKSLALPKRKSAKPNPTTAPEKLKAQTRQRAKSEGNVVLGTVISNPDKPLWPKEGESEGYSKIDLARYLEEVGRG